ncbi:hypothetical protein EsH8_V_000204 [Colletotrichum jinshuiense]
MRLYAVLAAVCSGSISEPDFHFPRSRRLFPHLAPRNCELHWTPHFVFIMGQRTVASNRPVRALALREHDHGAASRRLSLDASAPTDEVYRDLAYQFLRMSRPTRRATVADDDCSAPASICVSPDGCRSLIVDSPRPYNRRHSSFEPGTMPDLAYRVKEPVHNPRKHQRGSPSTDSLGEQPESIGERHCKRISGDSGYGSDTRRRRRERSRDAPNRRVVSFQVPSGPGACASRFSASESESDETLSLPRRPKRHLRRHSLVADTKTTRTPTSITRNEGEIAAIESHKPRLPQPCSANGLRRVKGIMTLRPKASAGQPSPSRPEIEGPVGPGISTSNDCRKPETNLQVEASTLSPAVHITVHPVERGEPRRVSVPRIFLANCHTNKVIARPFSFVEEQSDSVYDSNDDSSVESSVFSIPDSPMEPCQLQLDDPFAPHLDAVVTISLRRYRDWQARQRGGQGGQGQAQRVSPNTPDSSRSSRKRSHSDQPDQPTSDGDSNVVPGSKRPKVPAHHSRMLACPFWKKNPENHRHCYKKVLSKIKYVKSHLYRFHEAPITCPCCGVEFQNEGARDQHLRARRCDVVESGYMANHEGLSRAQMRQVSRRANPKQSEEEQWFAIWDTIFPDDPPPSSAYIDNVLSEDLCNFREFYTSAGTDIILDYLGAHDPEFAHSDRRSVYERVAMDQALDRIYEQWVTGRGLRQEAQGHAITPPQTEPSNTTESANASRMSLAYGNSLGQEPMLNSYVADDILPVPASALQFAGQDFGELDFRVDAHYDAHTQGLLDDLEGMFPGADERQYTS